MEDSCPATPPILTGSNSKSPLQIAISSPESERMKSPSRDSPDSRCVICLGRLHNKSFTDSCLHQFCFQCLLQWSKVKPECPLCKQPFKSIIHSVRSNFDYDQYDIGNEEPHFGLSNLMHSYNFDLVPVDRRFRYRSTMTREYFRELAESFLAHTRRCRLPEGSFQIPPMIPLDSPLVHGVRHSSRLANSTQRRERQRGTSDFRRNIYAQDLWVQDLVDISGRYRECSPQFYRENPAQIHRIIPWLNREVNVLLNECESRAAYVLTRIVSSLTHHSIRSREFRDLVYPYFGDRTDHFIHELYTFARSVYDITGFDQHAVYTPNPNYATEVQEISSSNEDSDIEVIEMVKSDDKNSEKISKRSYKKILLKSIGEETHHVDEPVPGPSGIIPGGNSESVELGESDSDDVKVLDYVKPEPEIVTLSSGEESNLFSEPDYSADKQNLEELCPSKNSLKDNSVCLDEKKKKKTGKGKCRSDGVGLKGKQKRKYIKSKKRQNHSTPSESSTSGDSSYRCSSSSDSDSESNRKHSSVSCESDSSSDNQPLIKSKKKKSKVSRKKSKKKIKSARKVTGKKGRRSSGSSHTGKSSGTTVKKIKSCVVVPSPKSWETSPPDYSSRSSGVSDDRKFSDSSKSRASSSSRKHRSNTSSSNSRKSRRDSSSEQGSGSSKRKHKGGTSNERVKKKIKDLTESSYTDDCTSKSSSVPCQELMNEELSVSSCQSKVWDDEQLKNLPENQSLENFDTASKSTFSHSLSSGESMDSFASKTNSVSSVNSD